MELRSSGDSPRIDTPTGAGPIVLLVSPSALLRHQVKRGLTARGFVVVDVDDAALARPGPRPAADLVLLDGSPATAAGRRLLALVRGDSAAPRPRVPVLFLTDDPAARTVVLAVGGDGIVPCRDDYDGLAATLNLHRRGR